MYKPLAFVFIAIIGIASASSKLNIQSRSIQRVKSAIDVQKVGVDLCPECVDVAERSINVLLDLILDTGILGSCQTLCGALAQKTGSQLIGVICTFACDAVGIVEFIHMLDNLDIDPIWYCEMAKMCPGNRKKNLFLMSNLNSLSL